MRTERKRYAVVGVSQRAIGMYMDTIRKEYANYAELAAMVDIDDTRMAWYNRAREASIPAYMPADLDRMVEETRPDAIIIASPDATHHEYVVRGLQHDLDVVCEKPLTIHEDMCREIAEAAAKSKGNVRVTFNYRYVPQAAKIRALVAEGKIGRVVSVDLNWYLDTYHGSSYFQRWNRLREVSGGLSVHKACHHLDLVQWWIGQRPVEVFAQGSLNFYGPEGVHNPLTPEQVGDGRTCFNCDARPRCPYYMRWNLNEFRTGHSEIQLDEHVSGDRQYKNYCYRQCIFDPQINIEDTYGAVIRYDQGAILSYSLNGSVPYEGFRVGINGTEGRIEYKELHATERLPFPYEGGEPIVYIPMFGGRERIEAINWGGGHGGGDPLLRDEIFIGADPSATVERQAGLDDGIDVVLTGIALYRSALEKRAIPMQELRDRAYGTEAAVGG